MFSGKKSLSDSKSNLPLVEHYLNKTESQASTYKRQQPTKVINRNWKNNRKKNKKDKIKMIVKQKWQFNITKQECLLPNKLYKPNDRQVAWPKLFQQTFQFQKNWWRKINLKLTKKNFMTKNRLNIRLLNVKITWSSNNPF